MRDALLIVLVLASLPYIVLRPPIGVFMWSWLGYMNPHRLTWGFAYDFPFAQLVAASTLGGLLFYKGKGRVPLSALTVSMLLFVFWMTLSTFMSIYPEYAWSEWDRTIKIQLFTFLTIILVQEPRLLKTLVWVIVISLGFYGIKGGVFALMTGGNYLVWGPEGSFIGDNNSLALALLMIVPLMRFCQIHTANRKGRILFGIAMALTAVCIFSSHSRGALLGAMAMVLFAWWNSRRGKLLGVVAIIISVIAVLMVMPDHWFERMATIAEYDQDASAMGRVNAWWFAFNLALDRPLVGGGFQAFSPELFLRFAPEPEDFHDAHSVYFEVLAEHGFVGLFLFLLIGILALRLGKRLTAQFSDDSEHAWISQLAGAIRTSLVGYAVTGAFLGLAYFDLYYQLVGMLVVLNVVAMKQEGAVPAEIGSIDPATGSAIDEPRDSDSAGADFAAIDGPKAKLRSETRRVPN